MLASARQSASSKGLGNISFENVDAQTYPFEHLHFDLVISQFGLMFFADPVAAFSNVKSGLRQEAIQIIIASICNKFGAMVIGLGEDGIRFVPVRDRRAYSA